MVVVAAALAAPVFVPAAARALAISAAFISPGSGSSSSATYSISGGTGLTAPGHSTSQHFVIESGPGATAPAPTVNPPPRDAAAGFLVSLPRPNPFTSQTTLSFQLPRASEVTLRLYSPLGRLEREIRLGAQSAGTGLIRWDGRNDAGERAAAGIYFFRFDAGPDHRDGRIVLLR
jgi:hypothetical protein